MATDQLHIVFFPLMAPGHSIPLLDIVRLFAARNVRTTVITTPLNAPNISKQLVGTNTAIEIFPFPSKEAGLPEGIENFELIMDSNEMIAKFTTAVQLLECPLEKFLEKSRPNCLIADLLLPFATDVAAKFGIPRIMFQCFSLFSHCAEVILLEDKPQTSVLSDDEQFILPNFPHDIKLTRLQLDPSTRENMDTDFVRFMAKCFTSDRKSYGVIFNSFYELEPGCTDYFKKVLGIRVWHLGPVALGVRGFEGKSERGKKASIDENECLKWLDTKEPNSVIYISFGSLARFSSSQHHEIAMALETSGIQFIWVVKIGEDEEGGNEQWFPDGFEERMKGKGLIIRGWAPQVPILEHEAIGGFVTHCGWNSILEGVSAGVPLVTWPLFAEQFVNEKLVTEILKIGVSIGYKEWNMKPERSVLKHEKIKTALRKVMFGEEALEMRSRVNKLKEMAWKAVKEGGSSHSDLGSLIQELTSYDHSHHS